MRTGLVRGSDASSTAPNLAAIALGPKVLRVEFAITATAAEVKTEAEYLLARGVELLPLAGFSLGSITGAQAKGLKAWAEALAPLGVKYIEFGNEIFYTYKNPENEATGKAYGEKAKEAAEALVGTGVKLLLCGVGWESKEQLKGLYAAWPNAHTHAAFGGWVAHPYSNQHIETDADTQGVPIMEHLIKCLETEHADTTSGVFCTEWGEPCTAAGRTMSSGQSMDFAEAAGAMGAHRAHLETASKGRMAMLLLYQAHDQTADNGVDAEREHFFGALTSTGATKGAWTTFIKSFLAGGTVESFSPAQASAAASGALGTGTITPAVITFARAIAQAAARGALEVPEPAPPPVPAEPASQMAAEVYAALEPIAAADEANGFPLRGVVRAIGTMFQQVEDAVRSREGFPRWTQPFDVERTPDFLVPFLGQAVGVPVTLGLTAEAQRQQVEEEGGWQRQKPSAFIAAIQATLTGTKRVRLTERYEGHFRRLLVATQPAETPFVAVTELTGNAAKPLGRIVTYIQTEQPLIGEGSREIALGTATIAAAQLADIT